MLLPSSYAREFGKRSNRESNSILVELKSPDYSQACCETPGMSTGGRLCEDSLTSCTIFTSVIFTGKNNPVQI